MSQRSDGRPLAAASVLVHDEDCLFGALFVTPARCRAQRGLGKNEPKCAEAGCHSHARTHADAPEATAHIGNMIVPDRLSTRSVASALLEAPNSAVRERKN